MTKTTVTLGDVLGGFLRDVAQAQAISDEYSLELARIYVDPSNILDAFSIPNARFGSVEIDFKYAIVGLSTPADPVHTTARALPSEAGAAQGSEEEGTTAREALAPTRFSTFRGPEGTAVLPGLPSVDVVIGTDQLREYPPELLSTTKVQLRVQGFPVTEVVSSDGPTLTITASRTSFDEIGESSNLILTVRDAFGAPLTNQAVDLTQRPGSLFSLPKTPPRTNDDGKASAVVKLQELPAEPTRVVLTATTTVTTQHAAVEIFGTIELTIEPFDAGQDWAPDPHDGRSSDA